MAFETTSTGSSEAPTSTYHSASAGFGLLDDVPPSYDSITSGSPTEYNPLAGGSGSGSRGNNGEGSSLRAPERGPIRLWPTSMNSLFAGPPNAEPMISPERVAAGPDIEIHKSWDGVTQSWDKRLEDPDVLYDFIRAQALNPPVLKIRCFATHTETAQVSTTVLENGHARNVSAGERRTITDFDFTIDLSPVYTHQDNLNNVHLYVRGANVPAYRGTHQKTFGASVPPNITPGIVTTGRPANHTEIAMWDAWTGFCNERGRAPWSNMDDDEEFWLTYSGRNRPGINLGQRIASLTRRGNAVAADEEALLQHPEAGGADTQLKQWCEAYCADKGLLKSFVLHRVLWGWDLNNLRTAIERAILSTGYQPSATGIQVHFSCKTNQKLVVRPNNMLVRATCHPFVFFLLCITLIYPLIWLWQRLSPRGGGPYEVAYVNYAMKFYPPLPGTFPNETVEQARHRLPSMFKLHREVPKNPFLHRGPKGVHYLLGRREGEWFRQWEEPIRMGVRMRYQGDLTLHRVDEDEDPPELDGY